MKDHNGEMAGQAGDTTQGLLPECVHPGDKEQEPGTVSLVMK